MDAEEGAAQDARIRRVLAEVKARMVSWRMAVELGDRNEDDRWDQRIYEPLDRLTRGEKDRAIVVLLSASREHERIAKQTIINLRGGM